MLIITPYLELKPQCVITDLVDSRKSSRLSGLQGSKVHSPGKLTADKLVGGSV